MSRKSRVSCTSILNLFFFLNVPYSNCVCSLFYTVHFCTFLSPWCPSIEEKRESNVFIWIYYFRLTYFNLSQCYTYTYTFILLNLYHMHICTRNIKVYNLYIYNIQLHHTPWNTFKETKHTYQDKIWKNFTSFISLDHHNNNLHINNRDLDFGN